MSADDRDGHRSEPPVLAPATTIARAEADDPTRTEPGAPLASTHTEIYRRFHGELRSPRWRWAPIFIAGWSVATKRKLALVLYLPPAIATVIFSFIVYGKFALESGVTPEALGASGGGVSMIGAAASTLIEVRSQILLCIVAVSFFALLIMSWYGSGLIAEDRRLGAHLLYFARPITFLDYAAAKFCIVSAFGLIAVLVPGLVICLVAAFSSPHWSFLTEQSEVILQTIAFGCLWTLVIASTILAISSLADRKTFALAGTFGFFMISQGIAVLLSGLQRDHRWMMLGPIFNLRRVGVAMFGVRAGIGGPRMDWDASGSWLALAALIVVAWSVILMRVRRMEIVA
jgi:hypothetical protein